MKFQHVAGWAIGFALFYGTFTGRCQSAPMETRASLTPVSTQTPQRTSIKFISTFPKADGSTPKECQDVLAVLLPNMQAYPHPEGWTWFVACDEPAWARIQARQGNEVGSGILAITNRPARATIIRGSAMLHAYSDDYRVQPEHIIAHELCHIYLQSSDESKVDDLATHWVQERKAKHLAVLTR